MTAVAFDNTMLSILLNPASDPPLDKATKKPVDLFRERAESLVLTLQKARRKIILPTPACAELLTVIGPDAQQYINTIARSRVFELAAFDAKCASELALLNRGVFAQLDKKNKFEPYQKVKFDRQIVAICCANGVTELYTDDESLANRARMCSITPKGIAEIPIPDSARQIVMQLEPHAPIPKGDDDAEQSRPDQPFQGSSAPT
jgi:predicted nucleic acid-binding protein